MARIEEGQCEAMILAGCPPWQGRVSYCHEATLTS